MGAKPAVHTAANADYLMGLSVLTQVVYLACARPILRECYWGCTNPVSKLSAAILWRISGREKLR